MGPSTDDYQEFMTSLTEEDLLLVRLARDLYCDDWDAMVEDLRDRQQGRAYVFEVPADRLGDHLRRIERLQQFEMRFSIKISSLLKGE
ncbi:MAG: hypothetical protein QF752_00530 [Planctomycetota bacterium]|jgi:hypothetical protein|nr:hypothetical protein [Planctomycetota bacterium]